MRCLRRCLPCGRTEALVKIVSVTNAGNYHKLLQGRGASPPLSLQRSWEALEERLGPYRYVQNATRLTSDTTALAGFARPGAGQRVCDLGCGAGALMLLLLAREPSLRLHGVDVSDDFCTDARKNMKLNGLNFVITCDDWLSYALKNPQGYDLVISNPPYYEEGFGAVSPSSPRALARTGSQDTLPSLCEAAGRLLKSGGRFVICYPVFRLVDVFLFMRTYGLEPKRIRITGKIALIDAKKGGKPGLESSL